MIGPFLPRRHQHPGFPVSHGLASIPLYLSWGVVQLRLLRSIPDRKRRRLYRGLFLFLIVGMPVGAPLEYRGDIVGLVLGATAYLTSLRGLRVST